MINVTIAEKYNESVKKAIDTIYKPLNAKPDVIKVKKPFLALNPCRI